MGLFSGRQAMLQHSWTRVLTLQGWGSDCLGDGGGGGRLGMADSDFSLKIDFNFLMLCVGARPLSLVRLN